MGRIWVALTAVAVMLLIAVPSGAAAGEGGKLTIRVGSKNFTEQFILAEMYAQALEAKGYRVERFINLGGTLIAHQAVVSGKIDMYPEYAGTALAAVVKGTLIADPEAVYRQVKEYYERHLGLTLLTMSRMNNGYVLVVLPETAAKYRLKSMSDLARVSRQLVLGAGPEWADREDGVPGLRKVYGMEFREFRPMITALKYQALRERQVDVINGFTTDGQITAMKLVRLTDDRNFWPPYRVAPVIRRALARNYPGIVQVLNGVTALLTDERQSELNWRVDGLKEEPRDVAREFLRRHGLVR
ncbi:MAG: glycine betaine ABC transporter substrate-binding protein [Armatimonadota bacterium]|nr:glycine betaine ABC transporter substrate-binding protein [Armatimonadota bacterium]MDR7548318.1 glycine betaine ABC transporter substrate-binding protein [Armatimonadota bacterium]